MSAATIPFDLLGPSFELRGGEFSHSMPWNNLCETLTRRWWLSLPFAGIKQFVVTIACIKDDTNWNFNSIHFANLLTENISCRDKLITMKFFEYFINIYALICLSNRRCICIWRMTFGESESDLWMNISMVYHYVPSQSPFFSVYFSLVFCFGGDLCIFFESFIFVARAKANVAD